MSMTSVAEVQALVRAANAMSSSDVQAVIDRIEAEITAMIGDPYTDSSTTISETHSGGRGPYLFSRRRIQSVASVVEYQAIGDSGTALTEDVDYQVWPQRGMLERNTGTWGERVVVTYVPADDRDAWKQAVIDLARIDIERTAQYQESVGGEYSYTAPRNWDAERASVLRRLRQTTGV